MAATGLVIGLVAASVERHLVRGESMLPTLAPRDTVVTIRRTSLAGRLLRLRPGQIVVLRLPWEHDLLGVKRLAARPGEAWSDGEDRVRAGPGWAVVGDERTLSTDSRHHGRVPTDAILGVVVATVPAPTPARVEQPESTETA